MNDVGNLLQMIYDLLSGWFNSFTSHALAVMEKLNLIETDTASIKNSASGIKSNTDDIKDNTGAIVTPVLSIKTNTDSIKTDTTTIKNNVSTMANQLGTISTNVGTASAFTEDIANNTLDIKDKVVTIASDTTQIRSNTNTVVTDLDKVYEALKWSLMDKVTTETVEGTDSISFNTDLTNDLVELDVDITATQSGTGVPSPTNVRSIIGNTDKTIIVNGNSITISFGQTVYDGIINAVNGKIILLTKLVTYTGANTEAWTFYQISTGNLFRISVPDRKPGNIIEGMINSNFYLCNQAVKSVNTTTGRIDGTFSGGIKNIDIVNDNYSDVTSWKNYLSSNNLQFKYELETPIEVQLTTSQIATIKGINTILSDDTIKCTYEESVKHYLDKQEA